MMSDTEVAEKIHSFLRTSDLKKTTTNIVFNKLQSDYGVDLSSKKPFVRDQITIFLQSQYEVCEFEELEDNGFYGEDDANDDVSYGYDNDDDDDDAGTSSLLGFPVQPSNGDTPSVDGISNESIDFKDRPDQQQKEKIGKACLSGKYCILSPQLQKFLGVNQLTQAEVVKHLWSYVKEKNLQDPHDGESIICDDTLRGLFGVDSINFLQINTVLSKHILPRDRKVQKVKSRKQEREEDPCGDQQEKRPKRTLSGFLAPLPISETLISFLGTGETALTRADVIKRIWEYIKDKKLQDPCNKKMVICDEKLKELFNVDSFHGFFVSKLLSAHLNVKM